MTHAQAAAEDVYRLGMHATEESIAAVISKHLTAATVELRAEVDELKRVEVVQRLSLSQQQTAIEGLASDNANLKQQLSTSQQESQRLREALEPFAGYHCENPVLETTDCGECRYCKVRAALAEGEKGEAQR